jgi:hypothetical protein
MSRADKIHMDDSELRNLYVDLRGAPFRVHERARAVLKKGAKIVDAGMTKDAAGHEGNWFGVAGTQYDTHLEKHVSHELITPLSAEIGIEAKGVGKIAHIIAFGSVNNPGGQYDHTAALRRSTPAIERMFADAAEGSVLGGEK